MGDKGKKNSYTPLSDEAYYAQFEVEKKFKQFPQVRNTTGKTIWEPKNTEMIEAAYKKAWECRDFEIDKTWTRSAYFMGFQTLIFAAFTTVNSRKHLGLYLILLGILFSIAWLLVIIGSKAWQESWEKHIDYLEDFISGPLYKTIFRPKSFFSPFFSVSKINIVVSIIVCVFWIGIFLDNYIISCTSIDWEITAPVIITGIISGIMLVYTKGKYKLRETDDTKMEEHIKNHKGTFINRDE